MITALLWLLGTFLVVALVYPPFIRFLKQSGILTFHWLKTDRDNRAFYELHQKKIGTPSMGGIPMIVAAAVAAPVIFRGADLLAFLLALVPLALLGLADDVTKVLVRSGRLERDMAARPKIVLQWLSALAVGYVLHQAGVRAIDLPFGLAIDLGRGALLTAGGPRLELGADLGWLYVPAAAFVVAGAANAVNITDGLDGLAGGLLVIALAALMALAAFGGRWDVFAMAAVLAGATLGFLLFNVHPARVIMGDVGALGLGGAFGALALMLDQLAPFVVIALVFVVETLSSWIQIIALRRGRRVFKIAPLHHHLEKDGWPETRITLTFWVLGAVLAFAGVLLALL